jgi:hypothetical protein
MDPFKVVQLKKYSHTLNSSLQSTTLDIDTLPCY